LQCILDEDHKFTSKKHEPRPTSVPTKQCHQFRGGNLEEKFPRQNAGKKAKLKGQEAADGELRKFPSKVPEGGKMA
jgi:hypothetical protein